MGLLKQFVKAALVVVVAGVHEVKREEKKVACGLTRLRMEWEAYFLCIFFPSYSVVHFGSGGWSHTHIYMRWTIESPRNQNDLVRLKEFQIDPKELSAHTYVCIVCCKDTTTIMMMMIFWNKNWKKKKKEYFLVLNLTTSFYYNS